MASKSLETIAIVGSGTMGAQIAALAASGGYNVRLFDQSPEALDRGYRRALEDVLPAIHQAGILTGHLDTAAENLHLAKTLEEAVSGANLVIEAVREEVETKRTVFRQISNINDSAILATNSSSLPSSMLRDSVDNPERLLNMHFFAPIWVRSMLELMTCGVTSADTFDQTYRFGRSLDLVTVVANGESKGFIINRIWRAVKRESLQVIDEGVATPEDIDRLWMMFFQTEYAPFGVMDMVGLDVVADIEASYRAVSTDPADRPSMRLHELIDAGHLGEKSGAGFYQHPDPAYRESDFLKGKGADERD